jgi:REP element-mobilizing transposase RayT
MRPTRKTYTGALHYILHRGLEGKDVFFANQDKMALLDNMKRKADQARIKIFAYCITDNDYRLVIENTSGRMSDFLKNLNGEYGMYYRRQFGGKGVVFYDRYFSALIQNRDYLKPAIAFVLLTPVREGFVEQVDEYIWSSAGEYFRKKHSGVVDVEFVRQLFGSKAKFNRYIQSQSGEELPQFRSQSGYIIGERSFLEEAVAKYNDFIAAGGTAALSANKKVEKEHFESPEQVMSRFEQERGIELDKLDLHTYKGKRLRGELLVELKEKAGLTYPLISKISLFHDLKVASLGRIYQEAKKRLQTQVPGSK